MARAYANRFVQFDGRALNVRGVSTINGDIAVIRTTGSSPSLGRSFEVDWVVGRYDAGHKIVDVVINGVSTCVDTKRRYLEVLQTSEGNLDTLTSAIDRHLARLD